MLVKEAPVIWNYLKGIICVYKPAGVKIAHIRKTIMNRICAELNEMECRPPIDHVFINGEDPTKTLTVDVQPNLADDPMVVGPRYQFKDLRCSWSNHLGTDSSGVLLLGLRSGTSMAKFIRENRPTRSYKIKGQLGLATENYFKGEKIIEKSTFRHVKLYNMEKLLSNMQAAHQRKMFELCGVDMQSQTAYDLAIKGPIRPNTSRVPVLYGIKCVEFNSPDFTIEVQCINEYEMYMKTLIHEIGMKLHSTAHCTGIQCIRHSYFTLEHALLRRYWTLDHVIANMEICTDIIAANNNIIKQDNIALN